MRCFRAKHFLRAGRGTPAGEAHRGRGVGWQPAAEAIRDRGKSMEARVEFRESEDPGWAGSLGVRDNGKLVRRGPEHLELVGAPSGEPISVRLVRLWAA